MTLFRKWFGKINQSPIPLSVAIDILGKKNVISANEVSQAWRTTVSDGMVPYSVAMLEHAAEKNRSLKYKFHLFRSVGFDLKNLLDQKSDKKDSDFVRCFSSMEEQILGMNREDLVHVDSQYMLMDFTLHGVGKSWDKQQKMLATKALSGFDRAPASLVAEAVRTAFITRGICLLPGGTHFGELVASPTSLDGEKFPLRICHSKEGVSTLMCLSISPETNFPNSGMFVIRTPKIRK